MEVARLIDRRGELGERRSRPGVRAQGGDRLVVGDLGGPKQLRPGRLLGPELAQPQFPVAVDPDEHPRGPVAERSRLS